MSFAFFIPTATNGPKEQVYIPDSAFQSGNNRVPYRTITAAMSPYTPDLETDGWLGCDTSGNITIQFPSNAPAGQLLIITDITGQAAARNVLGLRPPGGQVQNTSGGGSFVILSANNQSICWICQGNNKWNAWAQF